MPKDEFVRAFGNSLMNSVRDPAIVSTRTILEGNCLAAEDRIFLKLLEGLSIESKQLLEQLVTKTIDLTIFSFLSFFEQQQEFVLAAQSEDELLNLNELSDGLGGELWGKVGWIQQFSNPESYLDDSE